MNISLKAVLCLLLPLTLTACLDVEDNDEAIVAALDRQNELIEAQAMPSVSLSGSIYDLGTETTVDATVRVKVGGVWSEPVATTEGQFDIADVAPNSDFELLVESPTEAFMPRVVYSTSRAAESGTAFQDLGQIKVSQGMLYSIPVLNQEDDTPVEGLVFKAYSSLGAGASVEEYAHVSSFNREAGVYEIMLPEFMTLDVYYSLDLNRDGLDDYKIKRHNLVSLTGLSFIVSNRYEIGPVYLAAVLVEDQPLQLRVSVIDSAGNTMVVPGLHIIDDINGKLDATFDQVSGQYIFDTQIDDELDILLPAFSDGEDHYESASIDIERNSNDDAFTFTINNDYGNRYQLPDSITSADLVIQPTLIEPESQLKVVTISDTESADKAFKVFYSSGISLPEGAVTLVQQNAFRVTRGNDTDDDFILPGSTIIARLDRELSIDTTLALNNTLLTVMPTASLQAGGTYAYQVGDIVDQITGIESNLDGDSLIFDYALDEANTPEMAVSDILIDNSNFFSEGEVILAENTAGEIVDGVSRDNSVRLFLPISVANLESLTLVKTRVIEDSVESQHSNEYRIVEDGRVLSWVEKTYAVDVARNEDVDAPFYPVTLGASIDEGFWYRISVNEFMNDNFTDETNMIVFEYELERNNGEVETGTITLPVH